MLYERLLKHNKLDLPRFTQNYGKIKKQWWRPKKDDVSSDQTTVFYQI